MTSTRSIRPPISSDSSPRIPDAGVLETTRRSPRLTLRGSGELSKSSGPLPEFQDLDLTAQTKGVAKSNRSIRHLSPKMLAKVEALTDPLYLRRGSEPDPAATAHRKSFDKSQLWSSDQLLANPTDMNDEYVSVAVSPLSGDLFAVFAARDLGGTDRDIHISRSGDGGTTWQTWEMPAFNEDEYHPEIAIDGGGYIHVTWVRSDGYILRSRTTQPDGVTQWAWVKGLAVGEPCATPSIAVSGAGDFAKVFIAAGWLTINYDYLQYEWTMVFMHSTNGGNSVVHDYFLPDGYADYWPDVAMSGGTVHFVNAEVDAYTGETEILIATDGYAGSFSEPASLTGWTVNNTGFPRIACQGDDLFIVYQLDWTDGVTSDGDIIYSYSWDAGQSFFGPYGMAADEYESLGPDIFTHDGMVGCIWLDAPAGADEFLLAGRLGSAYGNVDYMGTVEVVSDLATVEPTFHSTDGVVAAETIHAAWIDRRNYPTQGHDVFTSTRAMAPDLGDFTPTDWDTSLTASMFRGDRRGGWLSAGDTTFVSFAFLNDGLKEITGSFFIDLELDGQVIASWSVDGGLGTGTYLPVEDHPVIVGLGTHTIRVILDPENQVAEQDETDNIISGTFTWIRGSGRIQFEPSTLIEVIAPQTKRSRALDLVSNPLTRREVHLPVIHPRLQQAMDTAPFSKSGPMLRVMIVPAERLDPGAMSAALKTAAPATRREVVIGGARSQMENNLALLDPQLDNLVATGLALPARPLWLAGMIVMEMSAPAIEKLATNPDVGQLWLDDEPSRTYGGPAAASATGPPTGPELDKAAAWHLAALGAQQAWAAGQTGQGVLVGHIDSGVAYDHPDLAGQMWDGGTEFPNHGFDAVDEDLDPYDGDTDWYHGTHTAGLIVGDGSAGTATGVAPGATLMALRGVPGYYEDLVQTLQFGLDHGVQIFSMSAGWTLPPEEVRVANRYNAELLLTIDIPWICASGNGDAQGGHNPVPTNISSPGDSPGPFYAPNGGHTAVFTVGGLTSANTVSATSSYGPTEWNVPNPNGETDYHDYLWPPGLMKPDIAAPGDEIVSCTGGGGYVTYSGTSMACPLVTGSFCLLMGSVPGLTPAQLAETFETTATDITVSPASAGRDPYTGAGLVNIPAALGQAPTASGLIFTIRNLGNLPLVISEIYSTAPWISVGVPEGFIEPYTTLEMRAEVDLSTLAEGIHQATLLFVSNDPAGVAQLPVSLMYGELVTDVNDDLPGRNLSSLDSYPNPFNPRTMLRFELGRDGHVTLDIHDIKGRRVRRLVQGHRRAGSHEVVWDGLDDSGQFVASGTYLALLKEAGSAARSRKMQLIR